MVVTALPLALSLHTTIFAYIYASKMAAAAPLVVNGAVKMANTSQAYLESGKVRETKALITELCRHFYTQGWVSGTGGSITIKVHDDSIPKPQQLIVMSPSGIYA